MRVTRDLFVVGATLVTAMAVTYFVSSRGATADAATVEAVCEPVTHGNRSQLAEDVSAYWGVVLGSAVAQLGDFDGPKIHRPMSVTFDIRNDATGGSLIRYYALEAADMKAAAPIVSTAINAIDPDLVTGGMRNAAADKVPVCVIRPIEGLTWADVTQTEHMTVTFELKNP